MDLQDRVQPFTKFYQLIVERLDLIWTQIFQLERTDLGPNVLACDLLILPTGCKVFGALCSHSCNEVDRIGLETLPQDTKSLDDNTTNRLIIGKTRPFLENISMGRQGESPIYAPQICAGEITTGTDADIISFFLQYGLFSFSKQLFFQNFSLKFSKLGK